MKWLKLRLVGHVEHVERWKNAYNTARSFDWIQLA